MYSVILEDKDFIAVDKEEAVPCIRQASSPGLSDELVLEFPYLSSIPDYGITHRLDNETIGLVLVAKNIQYYKLIRAMFSDKKVKKTYNARVRGMVKVDKGQVDTPIAHSKNNPAKMLAVRQGYRIYRGKPRPAETSFRVISRRLDSTDLELETNTGLRHQIRVHLSSISHPICGDSLYGYAPDYPFLMLISKKIEYVCPLSTKKIELISGINLDKYKLG